MAKTGGIRSAEVTKGFKLGWAKVQLHSTAAALVLQQKSAAKPQSLQLTKLVFDRFECRRNASSLGFAFREGGQLSSTHCSGGPHRTQRELPVSEFTISGDIQSNADGVSLSSGGEAGCLVEGRGQQGLPDFTKAKRFTSIAQTGIEAATQTVSPTLGTLPTNGSLRPSPRRAAGSPGASSWFNP